MQDPVWKCFNETMEGQSFWGNGIRIVGKLPPRLKPPQDLEL